MGSDSEDKLFDRNGFKISPENALSDHELLEKDLKNGKLIKQWNKVLDNIPSFQKFCKDQHSKYHSLVKQGIPPQIRGKAWSFILSGTIKKSIDKYFHPETIPSNTLRTIEADVPRTFSTTEHYKKPEFKENLKKILICYACVEPSLAYTQGMSTIAAIFLMNMDVSTSFWCFTRLMNYSPWCLGNYYNDNFDSLVKLKGLWEFILYEKFPFMKNAVDKFGIETMSYIPDWFLTFFLKHEFSSDVRFNIFERFLVFGSRALISFGLVCVHCNQKLLNNDNFNDIMTCLQHPERADEMKSEKHLIELYDKFWLKEGYYRKTFQNIHKNQQLF